MSDADNKSSRGLLAHSKVETLGDLVEYAPGSVVSRTLVKENAGTITLFAFDGGEGLSEHTAPFDALVQVIDGTGEFVIDGSIHSVGAGQVILLPARVPHAVRAEERMKMLLTMIRERPGPLETRP